MTTIAKLLLLLLLMGCDSASNQNPVPRPPLLRGINLAGDFEVEPRGAWGTPIQASYFDRIAKAGFDHVRIPIRWSSHNDTGPAFLIDEPFFEEVDGLLDQAERVGLSVIIDNHFFEELDNNPQANRAELIEIWRQIASRYANRPDSVLFELNNEPTGAFDDTPALWNNLLADTLAVVRESNPQRRVIVGPVSYNNPSRLTDLTLPQDNHLIATIHVYDPSEFTHQGASWVDEPLPNGVTWNAERYSLGVDWFPGSWDSTLTESNDGIQVAFQRQYAAFGASARSGAAGRFDYLQLITDQNVQTVVLCNIQGDATPIEFTDATTLEGARFRLTADISGCGDLASIAIQLTAEQLSSPVFSALDLCRRTATTDDCTPVITTRGNAHDRLMQQASQWAQQNGVPIYLGEFGVYDDPSNPVDTASRNRWLASVRTAAENYGIGWAVFAFVDEFGVFDKNNQAYRQDMMNALFD